MKSKKSDIISFESMVTEIEKACSSLESPDIELDSALSTFEDAIRLTRKAQVMLEQSEQKIGTLTTASVDHSEELNQETKAAREQK